MTMFYTLAARLSGMAAFVCAMLAVLTSPAVSRADDISDCYDQCAKAFDPYTDYPDFVTCTGTCNGGGGIQNGCSNSGCSKTCIGSFPTCGNGDCSKVESCVTAGCKCKIIYFNEQPRVCSCSAV